MKKTEEYTQPKKKVPDINYVLCINEECYNNCPFFLKKRRYVFDNIFK